MYSKTASHQQPRIMDCVIVLCFLVAALGATLTDQPTQGPLSRSSSSISLGTSRSTEFPSLGLHVYPASLHPPRQAAHLEHPGPYQAQTRAQNPRLPPEEAATLGPDRPHSPLGLADVVRGNQLRDDAKARQRRGGRPPPEQAPGSSSRRRSREFWAWANAQSGPETSPLLTSRTASLPHMRHTSVEGPQRLEHSQCVSRVLSSFGLRTVDPGDSCR